MSLAAASQAARQAHGRVRRGRADLADPRRPSPPALYELPRPARLREDRDRRRIHDGARDPPPHGDLERVLPLLLRHEGRGPADARRPYELLVHDDDGDRRPRRGLGARRPDRRLAPARRRPVARSRGVRRPLGADELRAADLALPCRGAVDRVRRRQRCERADHRRGDRPARRRPPQGPDRRRRRQLHRHAHRLRRAARLPALPARPPVLPRPASADEPLRHAARAERARALGDQLHRPDLHRRVQGPGRGRRLLGRRAHLLCDRLSDDRLPPRLAGVRLLDRGRP